MVERGQGEAHSFELTGAPEGGLWGGLGGQFGLLRTAFLGDFSCISGRKGG